MLTNYFTLYSNAYRDGNAETVSVTTYRTLPDESSGDTHCSKMAVFEQKMYNKVVLDDTVALTCTIEAAHNVKDHTVWFDNLTM